MKTLSSLFLVAAFSLVASSAYAEDDPGLAGLLEKGADVLLEEIDKRHNRFVDQTLRVTMSISGGASDGKVIETTTYTKGTSRRAVRMHAPADLKGMGVVVKSRDEIYVRLPDSRKVRRVGAHARRQTFMGTEFNFDDMSMVYLGIDYSAKVAVNDGKTLTLELTRKAGVDLQYPKLIVNVDREKLLIDNLQYFNEGGEHIKTQSRKDPRKGSAGGYSYYTVQMKNEKTGNTTTTSIVSEKENTGIKDRVFGKRWLSRER